jgi:hypothetical protein
VKYVWLAIAVIGIISLPGCGGSSNYSILDRTEGPAQITYDVQVQAGTPQSEVEVIARELEARGNGKSTMTNFYDGAKSADNMIFNCYDGACYDVQPNR